MTEQVTRNTCKGFECTGASFRNALSSIVRLLAIIVLLPCSGNHVEISAPGDRP